MNSKTRGQGISSDEGEPRLGLWLEQGRGQIWSWVVLPLNHHVLKMHVGHSSTRNPNLDLRKHSCQNWYLWSWGKSSMLVSSVFQSFFHRAPRHSPTVPHYPQTLRQTLGSDTLIWIWDDTSKGNRNTQLSLQIRFWPLFPLDCQNQQVQIVCRLLQ